jgi:hypothetical protein
LPWVPSQWSFTIPALLEKFLDESIGKRVDREQKLRQKSRSW